MNESFWPVGERYDDAGSIREAVIEFRDEITPELTLRTLHLVMVQLVRLREHRPYVRLGWGPRHFSVRGIRGDNGEIPRRQLLAVRLADELRDLANGVTTRDAWAAPTTPPRSFVRISHVREDYSDRGPRADYLRHHVEAVTVLLESCDVRPWPADETFLSELATSLKASPDLFRIERWTLPRAPAW